MQRRRHRRGSKSKRADVKPHRTAGANDEQSPGAAPSLRKTPTDDKQEQDGAAHSRDRSPVGSVPPTSHASGPPGIGWASQFGLALAGATVLCSILTLADSGRVSYAATAVTVFVCALIGQVLRAHTRLLAATCVVLAAAAAASVLSGGLGFMLTLAVAAMAIVSLWAPTLCSRRVGRLLVPVALGVGLVSCAVAVTFYAAPSPVSLGQAPVAWLRMPDKRTGPTVHLLRLWYMFNSCSSPVLAEFQYELPSHASADADTRMFQAEGVLGIPTNLAAPTETVRDLASMGLDGEARAFAMVQPIRRGIGSCYLLLPAFLGPWTGTNNFLFSDSEYPALPMAEAENVVSLNGASLSVVSGEAPTEAGDPSTWRCVASAEKNLEDGPECSALLLITESWYATWQNLMLLVIGALFAAVVGLIGRAIAGFGWFAA